MTIKRNKGKQPLAPQQAAKNGVISLYRARARKKNLEFSLSEDEFFYLVGEPCGYCGATASNLNKSLYGTGDFPYNGLDRLDNSRGYSMSNVIPCCKQCNRAKGAFGPLTFRRWVSSVFFHLYGDQYAKR